MATQYTSILKLALPVTGELSGTWGDVVNNNITSMIEQAIAGLSTINTWTANAHTLTVADGTTSESRCAMLVAANGSGGTALSAAGEIICPAASKLYVLKNGSSYAVTLKTAAGTGVAVPAGDTAFLFCDGTNVNSCVTTIVNGHISGNLTVDGNTTLGDANTDTITLNAQFVSDLLPSTDNARDLGSTAKSWRTLYCDTSVLVGNLSLSGNTISSTDSNGNIVIAPNGTGDVQLDADTVRIGDSNANATLTTNGTGDLILNTNSGTNSGSITIQDGVNGNILIATNGSGAVDMSTAVTMSATTQNIALGTSQTTGTFTVGGAAQTGALTLDQSTKTHTLNLGTGATESGLTKTINLGTAGVSGSTTAINIGSANGTSTTLNGTVTAATFNSTTIDTTNIEVTNIKAKDGTAALSIADSTGVVSVSANPILSGGTANGVVYLNASKVATSGTALVFDGSNLGLGVTPSSWQSGAKAIQIGARGFINNSADSTAVNVGNNCYYSGTNWIYQQNATASIYQQYSGLHAWLTAASGTAGNTISFTQAMTLDANGRLLLGTTTGVGNDFFSIRWNSSGTYTQAINIVDANASASGTDVIVFRKSDDVGYGAIGRFSTETSLRINGTTNLVWQTGGNERARITSGGYFKASNNGSYLNSTGSFHEFNQSANVETLVARNTFATFTENVLYVQADRNTTNNSFYAITYYNAGAAASKFRVADSGSISTAGSIQLGDAGAPPTSGVGVKFPATQSASTDANTLDDYEEGTWTPAISGSTSAGTATYSVQNARYTKIGRMVFVELEVSWSSGNGTGNLRVTGLPFTSANITTNPALAVSLVDGVAMSANNVLTALVANNSTRIELWQYPTGGGATTEVPYDAAGLFCIAGCYTV